MNDAPQHVSRSAVSPQRTSQSSVSQFFFLRSAFLSTKLVLATQHKQLAMQSSFNLVWNNTDACLFNTADANLMLV